MKEIASRALETARLRGASLAEARIVDERDRSLATKNGKISGASDAESLGIGIRVIADGGFGFAATDDLTRDGVDRCAARAVEIAKASARVKAHELHLVPEPAAQGRLDLALQDRSLRHLNRKESGAAVRC
jgi:TldD protein